MVVSHDRRTQVCRAAKVTVTGAEVDRGCGSGVGNVLRVLDSVTVGVDAYRRPRAGKELHRAHGAVIYGVPVQPSMVRVEDHGGAVRTVQLQTDDPRLVHAGGVQLAAAEAPMIALDPSDGSQQRPVDVAARV
jgi:hypothetical protein